MFSVRTLPPWHFLPVQFQILEGSRENLLQNLHRASGLCGREAFIRPTDYSFSSPIPRILTNVCKHSTITKVFIGLSSQTSGKVMDKDMRGDMPICNVPRVTKWFPGCTQKWNIKRDAKAARPTTTKHLASRGTFWQQGMSSLVSQWHLLATQGHHVQCTMSMM